MSQKKLIVSLHDATPKFTGELTEIVSELDRIGVSKRSILVVPNWEDQYDLRDHDKFVAWMHELKDQGNEIVHHGYNHRSDKREGHYKNPFQWFMGEIFAQGTGEFQNLSYEEAFYKIEQSKQIFSELEFEDVTGFIAPSWFVNPNVEETLKYAGYQYHVYTDFWNYMCKLSVIPIKNLETDKEIKSREVAFDSSRIWADYGTRGLSWLLTRNKKQKVSRIAIHPGDIQNARPFDYALELIKELKEDRNVCTYQELLALPKTL